MGISFSKKFCGKSPFKKDYAYKSLYDEGSHYGRHKGKKDKKNLNYVPQSKQPEFQDNINEEYLHKKRNSNYYPQSRREPLHSIKIIE